MAHTPHGMNLLLMEGMRFTQKMNRWQLQWVVTDTAFCVLEYLGPEINEQYYYHEIHYAALTYTEYPLRILKFEIRAEITEYGANGRGGACTKRCLCESLQIS